MLDTFTPDQKAAILASIMVDEAHGVATRQACQSQGITLQTYLDWKAHARKTLTVPHNGRRVHPERDKRRARPEREKTAFELAFEAAQVKTYPNNVSNNAPPPTVPTEPVVPHKDVREWHGLPEDNPEDLHALALERGEVPDNVPANVPANVPETPPAPPAAIAAPEVSPPLEEPPVPAKKPAATSGMKPRGPAAVQYVKFPWLLALEKKVEKELGPKPASKSNEYYPWIKRRKELMSPEQAAELEAFFGVATRKANGAQRQATLARKKAEQAQLPEIEETATSRAVRIEARVEPRIAPRVESRSVPPSPEVAALTQQHAEVTGQIITHELHGLEPQQHASRETQLLAENTKLKAALTAITLENLKLRGLL